MAEGPHRAGLGVALNVNGAVDTNGVVVTGVVRRAVAGEKVEVVRWGRAGHKVLVGLMERGREIQVCMYR